MAKVLVSINDPLLALIDRAAGDAGLSRSAYLTRLAERAVLSTPGPGRNRKVRHALERVGRLFEANPVPEETTAAVRAERDAR